MIQPISGATSHTVSQIQPVASRTAQPQEIPRQEQRPPQEAAVFEPSRNREIMQAGYGPDAALRTPPAETSGNLAAAGTPQLQTPSPTERVQTLYQQPENVIREFTRAPESMQGQQVDIVV